ncbi:MAG TPA: histidine kinase dimerization/phosphoacceptor domain -containing protein [Azospirillaceae bacterium]|nr:histidine kinase dimerization/phosphoacceptor domain -containing protein [Azospirillaceae bacterium]
MSLIVVVTGLGGMAALVAIAWVDYRATQAHAERELEQIARLMEEHARSQVQTGRIQLARVADLIGNRDLGALRGSADDWRRLNAIMADNPSAHSLWIFDANADLVLATTQPGGFALNVVDREYFTAMRDSDQEMFISPLLWGKITGDFLFTLSRRVTDAEGRFRGVIASSVKARSFVDFYRQLRPITEAPDESVFALRKIDGSLVARAPLPSKEQVDIVSEKSPLFTSALTQAAAGTWRSVSVVDGIEKLFAFRRLSDLSLVVVVGTKVEAVFRDWWARTQRTAALVLGASGVLLVLAGLASRSARREADALLGFADKARQLETALADKDMLFQEVHHRVKNNLQLVTSLLSLQMVTINDEKAQAALMQALDRVRSMGLVHETLYRRNEAAEVDVPLFLQTLVGGLGDSFGAIERGIALEVRSQPMRLPLDRMVPLALIANEAVSNALKHAFNGRSGGRVVVSFTEEEGREVFAVEDDGVGLPEGGVAEKGCLGMSIIRSLVGQLGAEMELRSAGGSCLRLILPAEPIPVA